jgi:peroxiredoxin
MRESVAKGMLLVVLALSARLPASLPAANAQEPVKAHVMGDPLPGRDAPAFSLPYLTAQGPGPADQPFKLRAELGRVVVLAFVPGLTDSAAVALLRAFSSQGDSLFAGEVVVAAVASTGRDRLESPARALEVRLKVLPDSSEAVRRMYGVSRGSIAAYVIDPLGRISWRSLNINPYARATYTRIRDAVRKAGRSS